jgi:hypothetical protein
MTEYHLSATWSIEPRDLSLDRDQEFQSESDEDALEVATSILKSLGLVESDIVVGDWDVDDCDSDYLSIDLFDSDDHKVYVGCLRRKALPRELDALKRAVDLEFCHRDEDDDMPWPESKPGWINIATISSDTCGQAGDTHEYDDIESIQEALKSSDIPYKEFQEMDYDGKFLLHMFFVRDEDMDRASLVLEEFDESKDSEAELDCECEGCGVSIDSPCYCEPCQKDLLDQEPEDDGEQTD